LYKKNFSFLSLKRKIRGADLENVSQILFMEISTELCFLESILESFMGIEVLLTQNLTTHAQYRTNASKKQSWVPMAIKKGTFFDCRRKERGGVRASICYLSKIFTAFFRHAHLSKSQFKRWAKCQG